MMSCEMDSHEKLQSIFADEETEEFHGFTHSDFNNAVKGTHSTGKVESLDKLKNIFSEDDNSDFLGFLNSEVGTKYDSFIASDPVELENISQDSNSKTSGYGSSGRDIDSDDIDSDSDILSDSDYEETSRSKREKAIQERRDLLKNLMADLRNDSVFKKMKSMTPRAFKAKVHKNKSDSPYHRRQVYSPSLPPVTRQRSKIGSPNYSELTEVSKKPKLLVRFRPRSRVLNGESPPRKRPCRRSSLAQDHKIIDVKDVTEDMLQNIAVHSVGKKYDAVNGTSCHQCRQKTIDTKSCCRNTDCIGVRGQFCGPCLQNRYGESVRDVLLDPDWSCPVCRGFCNCSICRNRAGKAATGILIGLARFHGYSNVKDYLVSLKSENDFVVDDE